MIEAIGMVGLGVMGSSLSRNIARNGVKVIGYNKTVEVSDKFFSMYGTDPLLERADSLNALVQKLPSKKIICLLVPAGAPVDQVLDELIPQLSKDDIIIDFGNSHYLDTSRREQRCKDAHLSFIGAGISGGEEGALTGPSIMPGGCENAYKQVAPLLKKIAAHVDGPCVTYVGRAGSGHFVKMVHNGIEYGDMQLIAESYQLLKDLGGFSPAEISEAFRSWNTGVLESFLIEITARIFTVKDNSSDDYLVHKILDSAGQKGTGKWTAAAALDLGVPIPTLSAAVDARALSSMKKLRVQASKELLAHSRTPNFNKEEIAQTVEAALYAAKIIAYSQGWSLLKSASDEWNWKLHLGELARIWLGGCIIRAKFLERIHHAYSVNPALEHLLFDPELQKAVTSRIPALRTLVSLGSEHGVPMLAMASALSYYDSFRSEILPQNLTQAQRDLFGGHTFERNDQKGTFHSNW